MILINSFSEKMSPELNTIWAWVDAPTISFSIMDLHVFVLIPLNVKVSRSQHTKIKIHNKQTNREALFDLPPAQIGLNLHKK